jgi:hypothetical protein
MDTLVCEDFEDEPGFPGCCDSCHEDANIYGYDMLDGRLDDGRWYSVCCSISRWLDERKPKALTV